MTQIFAACLQLLGCTLLLQRLLYTTFMSLAFWVEFERLDSLRLHTTTLAWDDYLLLGVVPKRKPLLFGVEYTRLSAQQGLGLGPLEG